MTVVQVIPNSVPISVSITVVSNTILVGVFLARVRFAYTVVLGAGLLLAGEGGVRPAIIVLILGTVGPWPSPTLITDTGPTVITTVLILGTLGLWCCPFRLADTGPTVISLGGMFNKSGLSRTILLLHLLTICRIEFN